MAKQDYYEALGTQKGADDAELKRAYRQMAKKYHPDANPGDKAAEEKFKEVNEAYSVLSDEQKRAAYDQYGHAAFDGTAGGGGFNGMNMDFDMGDIFGSVFGDFFGGGGGRSRQTGPQRGSDVQVNIQIEFEESIFGVDREISLTIDDHCDTCGGTGAKPGTVAESCRHCGGSGQERFQQQTMFGTMTSVRACSICRGEGKIIKSPCEKCAGKGIMRKSKKIIVTVPKGIDNGQSIPFKGKGAAGGHGGPKGDLYVKVYVKPHKAFTRNGNNLYMDMDISFVQAALGDDLVIPTVYGDDTYVLKAGTQTGTTVTMRGKGVPNVRNPRTIGDLLIRLNVVVPTQLNDQQKDALRQYAEAMGETKGAAEGKEGRRGLFGKNKK